MLDFKDYELDLLFNSDNEKGFVKKQVNLIVVNFENDKLGDWEISFQFQNSN
jgi:hypothetical protein